MSFLGSLGKALGGAVTGFVTGGPAGAIAGGALALTRRSPSPNVPSITPPNWGYTGGFSADSVVYRQGILGNRSMGVYGPKAFVTPQYPSNPDAPQSWPGGGGSGQAVMTVPSCPMPTRNGGYQIMPSPCSGYHWNRGRYYVFGDCRAGTSPGVVEVGTRLVRNRRINPANAQAARRAARRLNGTLTLLRAIERTTSKIVGRTARRSRGGCRGGCKGKCKCG